MSANINIRQIYACLSVGLSGMSAGTFFAFSGVAIPMLQKEWNISLEEGSWIASLFYVGTIIGSLLVGPIISKIGAKKTHLFVAPMTVATWIWAAFGGNVIHVCLCRIVFGICYGFFLAVGNYFCHLLCNV